MDVVQRSCRLCVSQAAPLPDVMFAVTTTFVEADPLLVGLSRPAPEQDGLDAVIAERARQIMVISGPAPSYRPTGGRRVVVRMVLADLLPSQA